MNVLFLSNLCRRTGCVEVCVPRTAALAGLLLLTLVGAALVLGYQVGRQDSGVAQSQEEIEALRQLLAEERRLIAEAKAEQRAHLDALALKVAELQAQQMRLDALGGRLVELGKLDSEEFDFTARPPLGGGNDLPAGNVSAAELSADMERIAAVLADREDKLFILEELLMTRDLLSEVMPSGRPVEKGWLSSSYGKRTDPFSGKKSFHRGIDFAGKPGANVIAVASGVVVRSEKTPGYGNVVEIRHADGYSTLYGHNHENLVAPGEVVSKGQVIALLGNTGRSSGPHVHFEVHRHGRHMNPHRFIK